MYNIHVARKRLTKILPIQSLDARKGIDIANIIMTNDYRDTRLAYPPINEQQYLKYIL